MNTKCALLIALTSVTISAAWYDGPSTTKPRENYPHSSYDNNTQRLNPVNSYSHYGSSSTSSEPDFRFEYSGPIDPKKIEISPIIEVRTEKEYVPVPYEVERIVTKTEVKFVEIEVMHQPDFNDSSDLNKLIDNLEPQVRNQKEHIAQCDRLGTTIPGAHTHFKHVKNNLASSKDNKEAILQAIKDQKDFLQGTSRTTLTHDTPTEFGSPHDTQRWIEQGLSDTEIERNMAYYKSMGHTPGFSGRFLKKCDFYPIATFLAGVAGFTVIYNCVDSYMKQEDPYTNQPKQETFLRKGIKFGLASLGAFASICVSHKIMDHHTFSDSTL